ncbi:hypothetical protein H0H93_011915 [Arthromyces matolae]|nr:hypothetical protein H0H93_011915 [Arthromyces matolae]
MPDLENKLMISVPLHALTLTNYPAQAACRYGGSILIPTHDLPDTVSEPCTSEHDLQFQIETKTRSTNVVGGSVASLLQVLPLQDLNVLELMVSDATHAHFGLFGYLPSLHTINLHPDISLAEVSQGLLSNSEWETTSQLPYWYLEIRQSRLRPRIIDVDAENDRLTKGESEAALTELASVLLLRQQLQVPLDEVYVDSVYRFGSHDVQQDLVMIRQSVNSLHLGSVTYDTIDWGMG